jgi:hypothetical protein
MIESLGELLEQFGVVVSLLGLPHGVPSDAWDPQPAPHHAHVLPLNQGAVYVFTVSESLGRRCPVGPNRALKIGIAGPNSGARFRGQHYSANAAGSTLARSLLTDTAFWPALGIESLNSTSVGPWIRQNADRENFYVANRVVRAQFESFLHAKLDALCEGGLASTRFDLKGHRRQ